jgi:predicted acetyltransferase
MTILEGLNFSSSSNKSGGISIPIFENKQALSKFKEFAQNILKTQEERQTISDYKEQNKYFYELLDVYNQFKISKKNSSVG